MKLSIYNNVWFHYEIIETIICKYDKILNIIKKPTDEIYLIIKNTSSFKKYIGEKYPKIKFGDIKNFKVKNFNYMINCTIYDRNFNNLNKNKNSNTKYISHQITDRLKKNPNVYFLTPLCKHNRYIYTDILPFQNKKKLNDIPIYIIQGNITHGRRNYNLLIKILKNKYENKFKFKLVGKGNLPEKLKIYKDKIILKNNLDFINFHKEFLDAYCILPLISKNTHPQYYINKLTSTINYARGYKLKCLIDKDLQNIYKLKDVVIYNDINDISKSFRKSLEQFYNKN